jgi:hypothetical protein
MGESPTDGSLLQLKEDEVQDDGPNATKGLEFPRVQLIDTKNLYPMFYDTKTSKATSTYTQHKATLDKTHCGLVVYNTNGNDPFKKGLYIWMGSQWDEVVMTPWRESVSGRLSGSHTCNIYRAGNVTIGTEDVISADAALKVVSANKGVLFPRVSLAAPDDKTTIANPSEGLLVYNTGKNASFTTRGYMYWDGKEWKLISNVSSKTPAIDKWFYMPPVAFATDQDKTKERKDLYALYKAQFAGPGFKSDGAPVTIPYIPAANQLYYYVTYADPEVFSNIKIDENGIMTYDVKAAATEASYINIVFVLK